MITLLKLRPYTGDIVAPSPNLDVRNGQSIEGIVLHATADRGNEADALLRLRSPKSRASCHLLVGRSGRVTRLVGDRQRAWHAGGSWWRGTSDVDSVTLGIQIANRNDGEPYTDTQYARVAEIVAHYCRQGLSADDVVSHGEISGSRDTDPNGWDWDRFRLMVQHQLRASDVEGRRSLIYDRRGVERIAAEEAATYGSARAQSPAVPPAGTGNPGAAASGAPAWERRSSPRSDRRTASPFGKHAVPAITTPKPVHRSRTLWLNGLTVLAAISVMVGETLDLAFSVGLTVPQEITMWALFAIGVVNIFLRFRTSCPVGCGQPVGYRTDETTVPMPGRVPSRDFGGAAAGQR